MYFFKNIVGSLLMVLVISTEVKGKCTRPTTTDNAGIHPDDILKESFEEKSIIRLKCLPGYTASARSRLTCENGQWIPSPAEFLCQKKLCGSLDEFPNGQYEYSHEGNAYGAVVTAVCKSGFYIVGSNQRLCQADGTWDGRQPVCEVVKCGPAPTVINGKLLSSPQDEYEVDHAVLYKCDADYTLFEGDNVHCTSNGSSIGFWSSQPRCTMVRCERLDILNARRVAGGSGPYGYKTTLEYVCNDGFKMTTDSGRMVCEERGWALIPECKVVECPEPGGTNANIIEGTGGPYRYGVIIKYKCQIRHRLVGSPQLKCGSDGQWSSTPPTCQKIECPKVNATNATITQGAVGPYKYQSVIEYKCPAGQNPVGSLRLICGSSGQWSSKPPVCLEVVKCPEPRATNATFTDAGGPYKSGDVITYKCPAKQELVGISQLKCGSDGQWSSNPPVCKVVECPEPGGTNANIIEGTGGPYRYGVIIKYKCQIRHRLVGSPQLKCGSDGQWSSTPPTCQKIECPKVNATNATITQGAVGPYKYQSVIEYKCPAGQNPVGSLRLICGSSGQWSSKPPVCLEVVKCPEPRATNATFTDAGGPYKSGDVITYKCPAKQELVGISQLKCGSDGQWSSNPPVCKVVMCPEPPATNATRTDTGGPYVPGDIITYKCPAKQKLVGNSQLKCGSDGQWSSNPPVCKEVPGPNIVIIIIGILAALVIIIIIYCIWRRKNKQKTYTGPQSPAENQELKRSDAENAL